MGAAFRPFDSPLLRDGNACIFTRRTDRIHPNRSRRHRRTDAGRHRSARPDRAHTALYLAPTKALAHDQKAAAKRLGPTGWRVGTLDGDSEQAERARAAFDELVGAGSAPGA